MKTRKLLLISFIAIPVILGGFLFFNTINTANAQGTYTCSVNEDPEAGFGCEPGFANCEEGYIQGDCSQWDDDLSQCGQNPKTCERRENTYSCEWVGTGGTSDEGSCVLVDEICTGNDEADCGQFDNQVLCEDQNFYLCEPPPCLNTGEDCTSRMDGCCSGLACETNDTIAPKHVCVEDTTQASGTYSCEWSTYQEYVGGPWISSCTTVENNCSSGYVMEPECETIEDEATCNDTTNNICTAEEEAAGGTSRCVWNSGVPGPDCITVNNCDAGYEPAVDCEAIDADLKGDDFARNLCQQNGEPRNCVEETPGSIGESCESHDDCKDRLVCKNFECQRSDIGDACDEDRNCPLGSTCTGGTCTVEDSRGGGFVPCGGLGNPCTFCHFFELIHNVVEFLLFTLGPILASLMIVVGGFFVLTSRGNQSQYNKGKNYIKWALLGYLLMLGAWLIVNTILTMLDLAEWVSVGDWWKPSC